MEALSEPTVTVDRALAAIAERFDYLLATTPVNAVAAWEAFAAGGFAATPGFDYAPLPTDPSTLRAELAAVPLDEVDDPDLRPLLTAKQRELDRWIGFLEHRDTPAFLELSVDLYGEVDEPLLRLAEAVLERIPLALRAAEPGPELGGAQFAALVRREVEHYRRQHPALPTQVELSPSFPGVMVTSADVIVGVAHRVAAVRADGLVHHEVGTHVVTYVNGGFQPLRLLQVGLPGYEETQEGLGVLAEYFTGQLTRARLALLAARVLAARRLVEGASFADTFAELHEQTGLTLLRAWDVTMRTFRAGGLTKDAIYLRGFFELLGHLGAGGALEPLAVGKLDLRQLPVLERLRRRGLLREPVLRPRWFDHPEAAAQLAAARRDPTPADLALRLRW